ncbi:MAG TPA: transposase family protein [Acidimicrobiales bacterium]|nr:transposase family protein [Acidimicrobiales bacterium]
MIAGDRPSRLSEAQLRWLAGVSAAQFAGLVVELGPMWEADRAERLTARKRSRALGAGRRYDMPFATRLFVCLVYLRWNVGYRGRGAMAGFSKDTVNRAVDECTRLLAAKGITRPDGSRVGNEDELAEALEAVDHRALADGTFVPIPRPGGGWAAQKAEYSGHRHRHCRSTQVVTDVDGWLLWVTDDQPGPTHDLAALVGSGIPERIAAGGGTLVADRGYQGIGNHVESLDVLLPNGAWGRGAGRYNTDLSRLRVRAEHAIAGLKRPKILHGFRRRAHQLTPTLRAVAALTTLPA